MPTEPTDWKKRVEDVLPCIHETRICREEVLAILSEFGEEVERKVSAISVHRPDGGLKFPSEIVRDIQEVIRPMLLPKKEG